MKKALALSVAVFVTLLVCEIGLRLLWHNPYRHEAPDHLIKIRIHHAKTDYIFSAAPFRSGNARVRFRTDTRSYILPSFQYDDPHATVAFLGGSTSECNAVEENLRFPALVSTLFAEQGLRINTLNIARSGNTLHDSLNVLLNHVVEDRPDIAVLMHVSNDIGVLRQRKTYRSRMGRPVSIQNLAKWTLQIASSNLYLAALVRRSVTSSAFRGRDDPSLDWRHGQQPVDDRLAGLYKERLKAFVHICRDFGIRPVLMTQPFSGSTTNLTPGWMDRTAQDQFNNIVRELGAEEEVHVIDLVRHLQEEVPEWDKPMEVFYDAIHVTDKGSQIYARHIAEQLKSLIALPVLDDLGPVRVPRP